MNEQMMLDIVTQGIWVSTLCSGPLLVIGGGVGLLVALLQAATQLSEPAITFVPKLLALGIAIVFLGPWLISQLVTYNVELYQAIADVGP